MPVGAALPWLIPSALGAMGLIQQGNQQKSANNLTNKASAITDLQGQGVAQALGAAENYNPAQIAQQSGEQALSGGQQLLNSSLKSMSGAFTAGGGQPTGDTAFQGAANRTAAGIVNPITANLQQALMAAPQQKLGALTSVYQAPTGQMANTYFNAAAQKAPSAQGVGSSQAMLTQGLNAAISALSGGNVAPGIQGLNGLGPMAGGQTLMTGGDPMAGMDNNA